MPPAHLTHPPARSAPGRVVIIGAGPTGLGAARRLIERGWTDVVILERDRIAGGLAASHVDEAGFTWDLGGHVQFSHYEAYDVALDTALGGAWRHHARTACVRLFGVDVPYPFQLHLDALPEPHRARALADAARPRAAAADDSFGAWLRATFGDVACELFLEPYNRKIWQTPLEAMSARWVGERVARPAGADGSQAAPKAWGPNARFRYPASGGTGAIWTAIAGAIPPTHVRYGADVRAVDPVRRVVTLDDGDTLAYDTLISTMPADALVAATGALPQAVRDAAARLIATTVELVGIGVDAPPSSDLRARTWMYFPESDCPYYRVTVLSNYAEANAPDGGCYSLLTESSHPRSTHVDREALVNWTLDSLRRHGLMGTATPIRSAWHRTLPYGYPVPGRERDEALAAIHAALEPLGIYSRGRFGGWKYEVSNQDHSFMQGVEVADFLLDGTPEVTYHDPDLVNARYAPAAPGRAVGGTS